MYHVMYMYCRTVNNGSGSCIHVVLFQVVPVTLSLVTHISAVRLYIPRDLTSSDNRKSVLKSVQEVERRFPKGLPQLDPIEDMGIKDQRFSEIIRVTL